MVQLTPEQIAAVKQWFLPDRAGPLVGLHIIHTGHGACFADRWPDPQTLLAEVAGNYQLLGDPEAISAGDLAGRIHGLVQAPPGFRERLAEAFPHLDHREHAIYRLNRSPHFSLPIDVSVRRLGTSDAYHLWGLSRESAWIFATWGGPGGLAASGRVWGAFVEGRLVSVACTRFLGLHYEEIGAVTEVGYRGRGLGAACGGALCEDVVARGRKPGWAASPENRAAIRVAEKLGFEHERQDFLYPAALPAG